ncbi:macro domain-containing protein [Ellagibacter isourolithinifaciens]|uniref:macro domain-containing protein n=1 Tax=Ellagibacter isourolithinifaciens TaxID=2137581 RepID=UPI003A925A12
MSTPIAMAAERHCKSIAFCCISTGVFGFPQEEAARIAVDTARAWLDANPKADMHVIFDVYTEKDEQTYREILGE